MALQYSCFVQEQGTRVCLIANIDGFKYSTELASFLINPTLSDRFSLLVLFLYALLICSAFHQWESIRIVITHVCICVGTVETKGWGILLSSFHSKLDREESLHVTYIENIYNAVLYAPI